MGLRGRSYLEDANLFFVTTTVINYLNIFSHETACEILIKNIKHYQNKYKFTILAYVIMPSHFHWIVLTDSEFGTISEIMRDIKKYSAWDLMEYFEHDYKYREIFRSAAKKYPCQKRKIWMPRFDDQVIRNEKMFWEKMCYIHYNPVEAGLVDRPADYKYSSARNYLLNDHSILFVDMEYAGYPAFSNHKL